jgi:FMN phosphatase YigB (HAD superfamily)
MSALIRNWFKSQLRISDECADRFFETLRYTYPSALEAIEEYGLSLKSFHRCVFGNLKPNLHLKKDKNLQRTFSKLLGKKFLVTLSSEEYSKRMLEVLGVGQHFSGIYNPGVNWHTCRKVDVYEAIRHEYGLFPSEICIVGDNYVVDLEAAYKEGYVCVLLSDSHGGVIAINSIEKLPGIIDKIQQKER